MSRIAIGLEYDGSSYAGWQAQTHANGLQTAVEAALSFVANHPINVIAAGRTDAGVHATMQVVHFDTEAKRSERGWVMGANANVPKNISVLWARDVSDEFSARYSALSRSYRYVILNRMARPALLHERAAWVREHLDEPRMHDAAQHLIGQHDFSSYRAAECQSFTPVRRVQRIVVSRHEEYVVVDITANAFLHHMVRNIVGVLMAVGTGRQAGDWPLRVLQARDRAVAGITAPAAGLYLFGVQYSDEFNLPSREHYSAWPPGPVLPLLTTGYRAASSAR